jgi:hypothetical protein
MNASNWIALAAVLITVFGMLCAAAYLIIRLLIKSSSDDAKVERLKDQIEQLKDQIRDMN